MMQLNGVAPAKIFPGYKGESILVGKLKHHLLQQDRTCPGCGAAVDGSRDLRLHALKDYVAKFKHWSANLKRVACWCGKFCLNAENQKSRNGESAGKP